jgi:hypothetical protein
LSDRHAPLIDSPAATCLLTARIRAIFSQFVKRRLLALVNMLRLPSAINPWLAVASMVV